MFSDILRDHHSPIDKKVINVEISNMLDKCANIWLGADWHLYKSKDGVPFRNPNADKMIQNQISMVGKNDAFIFLGDFQNDEVKDSNGLYDDIKNLSGNVKIMVRGNNDIFQDDFYMNAGFNIVCDRFIYRDIIFTHPPIEYEQFQGAKKNFHGHIHFSKAYCVNYYNHADAFTPANDCKPIRLEAMERKLRSGFYSPDI